MDIKRHNVCCWLIGNCRDKPLTQRHNYGPSGSVSDINGNSGGKNFFPTPRVFNASLPCGFH